MKDLREFRVWIKYSGKCETRTGYNMKTVAQEYIGKEVCSGERWDKIMEFYCPETCEVVCVQELF